MAADNDPTHSVVVEEAEHDPAGEAAAEALARLRFVPADVYEVQGEIARGGMGVIFEAWDTKHERAVAIKTLQAQDPLWVRRFLREVQITAQLQHPSIIPLYEAGRWPTGESYYAMRLVEGQSLARAAEQAGTTRERLALLPHLIALSDALAYAHEKGIIHRDLKPTNVLVGRFGETAVIDWGLAKRVGEGDVAPAGGAPSVGVDLTMAGEVLGTLAFMAPEQARGEGVPPRGRHLRGSRSRHQVELAHAGAGRAAPLPGGRGEAGGGRARGQGAPAAGARAGAGTGRGVPPGGARGGAPGEELPPHRRIRAGRGAPARQGARRAGADRRGAPRRRRQEAPPVAAALRSV